MRAGKISLVFLVLLFSTTQLAAQQKFSVSAPAKAFRLPVAVKKADYRPGVIILKLKPAAAAATKVQAAVAGLTELDLDGASIVSLNRKFSATPTQQKAAASVSRANNAGGLDRIYELTFTGTADIVSVINRLRARPDVEYAEPDYVYRHFYTPNDPRYPTNQQTYLNQVKAPQAWDLRRNSSSVVIGIVDSGSDLLHEDLAANIFLNTADPINGIDDDRDGYVDNYTGWDLIGLSGSAPREDNDPNVKSDSTAHGVHVSGIASAVTDNGRGVASVAFNARLLIVKCGADNNSDAIYRGYEGIVYAADHGAQIINCSWGGTGGGSYGQDVIDYVVSKGCLVVAAAGNESAATPNYPAAYRGVLGVSAVSNTDTRSSYSNFGTYVGISAPGNSIWSTYPSNGYSVLSGTSMATPVVASAAALLKAYVPSLTMEQVGARLRATADNIDGANPLFIGQIGKGRLNVFRALSESPPSIKYQNLVTQDSGNGSNPAGGTIDVYVDLKNVLGPVTGLTVQLSTTSPLISVTTSTFTVGNLATGETKAMAGPFKIAVATGIADNSPVLLRLAYSGNGGAYADFENFNLIVSRDYLNVEVNKISTTFTSNGRIGYSSPLSTNGLGFVYKNENLLYEAALMIGISPTRVSDNARNATSANEHFARRVRASRVSGSTAAFEGTAEFDDSNNPVRLPVYVKHRQLALSTAPDDKYTIAEYEISNPGTTELQGVYIGLLTDFDTGNGTRDITKYDGANRIAYVTAKAGGAAYAAVKLLTTTIAPSYYPMSHQLAGDPNSDNSLTTAEKYAILSAGIKSTGLGETTPNGLDVLFNAGYGPITLAAGQSVKVAFALIAGDNLDDIQKSAQAAQANYLVLNPAMLTDKFVLYQNFPNPVTGNTTINYAIPKNGKVELSLFNMAGQRVRTYLDEAVSAGLHSFILNLTDLSNGIYIYRMKYGDEVQSIKLWVGR